MDIIRHWVVNLSFGLFYLFVGFNPAFGRVHRDTPMGGFSLWQIFIGGVILLVIFASMSGRGPTKEEKEERKRKGEEATKREKERKGLFRYYGEFALALCLWPFGPFILVGIIWVFHKIFG